MERKRMFSTAPYRIDWIKPFVIEKDDKTDQIIQEVGGETVRPFEIEKAPVQMETVKLQEVSGHIDLTKQLAKSIEEKSKEDEAKETISAEKAPVSNYQLIPMKRIIFITREGKEREGIGKIRTRVEIMGEHSYEIDIPIADIGNLANYIGKKFPSAIVNFDEPKAEKKIEAEFRMKTIGIPVLAYYIDAGWQSIDGKRVYLHDSVLLGNEYKISTGKNLPMDEVDCTEMGKVLNTALNLYKEGVAMSTMLLYSFSGVMYRLFSEAGYPPHFLLFINGNTGTMKTTIAKILFVQLCNDRYRENPRRIDADTLTSFERAIVKNGVDTIMLIDDYCPAKTASKRGDMLNKLEAIIRMVGDGSTKSRSNASLDDVQGEGVQGTVVLTGEIRGKGLSSNLRCLYCEIEKGKANEDVVTWFQENPHAFTTLIGGFTNFLSRHWDEIVFYIKEKFTVKRKAVGQEIKERRLVDSVVTLQIIAEVVERFCIEYCQFEKEKAHEMIQKMKRDVLINGKYSQDISEEESPALIFVRAIRDLMIMKKLAICDKESYIVGQGWDGFCYNNFYFLVPESIYVKVRDFLGNTGHFIPMDLHEIVVSLQQEGFVKSHPNGSGKRTLYARILFDGKKQKFLQFPISVFEELADEKF